MTDVLIVNFVSYDLVLTQNTCKNSTMSSHQKEFLQMNKKNKISSQSVINT